MKDKAINDKKHIISICMPLSGDLCYVSSHCERDLTEWYEAIQEVIEWDDQQCECKTKNVEDENENNENNENE